MTKKLTALLLSLSLLLGLALPAMATPVPNHDPIIILPGFTATSMFIYPNDPEQRRHVWVPDFGMVGDEALRELPGLLGGLLLWLLTRQSGVATNAFARAAERAVGMMAMNPDGTPVYDVGPFPGESAADFSLAAIRANEDPNAWLMLQLGAFARVFEEQVGAENVFVFQSDWRESNVENARQLRAFIQEVKEITGSETVRLFGYSYGGQLAGVYLAEFAGDRDVSLVVVDVPAFGGSSAVPDLLMGRGFQLNIGTLLRFLESYNATEGSRDFGWLLDLLPQQCVAPLAIDLLQAGILPIVRGWGGLWDLVPAADFDETLYVVMGDDAYWWLEDSIRLHHEIMPNWGEILRRAQEEYDIAVRIVANTGKQQLAGTTGRNSDGLLDVRYTTGARAAPLGERLAGGERLSPGGDIDAADAWLPDHTWFVQGQFHGASWGDPYAFVLLSALMLDPALNSVHCDPEFPQFGLSRSPSQELWARFDASPPGFLGEDDSVLRLENLMREHNIRVFAVKGLDVACPRGAVLAPGEALELALGDMPESGFATLRVVYRLEPGGFALPVHRRKGFDVTVI